MRILFFTDIHGNERHLENIMRKSHDADILVCPGDLTIFENNLDEIFRKLNSAGKPVVVVHGNHESASSMATLALRYRNIHFIHKSYFILQDVIFFGYGGDGFSTKDPGFDRAVENFMKEFDRILKRGKSGYKLILVTHAPPGETRLDDLGSGWHVGCKNYAEFIKREQPFMAVSGHIHETFGQEDNIGETRILNPGPDGMILEL